ncbi:Polyribonucleotide nucleotidyltransferase [Gracilariopsis chorda]|uniref:polyribonucleotide nucleotidyltransferase n=1 Tax=Gracilariopsis chorda TaxID=448386 RepID=A0A2V3J7E0_9FLOR|nr:Polyribonucleotide nucleotidyltransferase [Gracilariopsis chorda]|eukprot:PXF50163.1 Polyribonucleotide nucleotidyltransferase [Gracilariopsis chorda]
MFPSAGAFVPPLLLRAHPRPPLQLRPPSLPQTRPSTLRRALTHASVALPEDADDPSQVPDTDLHERERLQNNLSNAVNIPIPPKPTVVSVEFAPGKIASFETGHVSRQAAGAVNVRHGDTVVYCTACANSTPSPNVDFLPLRVDYSEKFSALGRTSGSYIKREGRPSEREILISRLMDRSLRPMFEDGYHNDVQILANVFSYDTVRPADALAICAAAASLHVSNIPLAAPVAGVRVSYVDGHFVVEPSVQQAHRSHSELIVAGTQNAILMIEGYCHFLTEQQIMQAVKIAHHSIKKLCAAMHQLRHACGQEKRASTLRTVSPQLYTTMEQMASGLNEALAVIGKKEREQRVAEVKELVFDALKPTQQQSALDPDGCAEKVTQLRVAWKQLISTRMRRRILDDSIRPDGRDPFTVRPITILQSPLPRAHGSSLFTRGETQTLAVATLGGEDMAQRYETLDGEDASRFYLQYYFPPSSVGEVGRVGPPGRREIGHGKLAERALYAAIPEKEHFPYVLRVESNILESNGSSSMASVCGGCLALMDAGVPLKCSVAGVAMGLVIDEEKLKLDSAASEKGAVVLTDILGLEDALGLCDAKFAGNREGLSALQLDVKLKGISTDLLERILLQAREGRLHILDCMDAVMPRPRSELPDSVPKVISFQIPVRRIGDVIGGGGKTIRSLIEDCGGEDVIRISIGNEGMVSVTSTDDAVIEKAKTAIEALALDVEVGSIVKGQITKILPFGAYVKIAEGKEGWLHISELENKRTNMVEDVCKVGDEVRLKVIEVSRNGQIRLSRRAILPKENKGSPRAKKQDDEKVSAANGNGNKEDAKLGTAKTEEVESR